ncbi:MAG: hypothetical protein E6G94_00970 [Alphaproteobacteria bacterium]|nr:MAG: hypothetical protein E6G94_00970 [Alphaproteobacteria bacterium]
MSDYDRDPVEPVAAPIERERVRESTTVVHTGERRGGGGVVAAVVVLLAVILLAFLVPAPDINVKMPDVDLKVPENVKLPEVKVESDGDGNKSK